jgi:hypothetical protein
MLENPVQQKPAKVPEGSFFPRGALLKVGAPFWNKLNVYLDFRSPNVLT